MPNRASSWKGETSGKWHDRHWERRYVNPTIQGSLVGGNLSTSEPGPKAEGWTGVIGPIFIYSKPLYYGWNLCSIYPSLQAPLYPQTSHTKAILIPGVQAKLLGMSWVRFPSTHEPSPINTLNLGCEGLGKKTETRGQLLCKITCTKYPKCAQL